MEIEDIYRQKFDDLKDTMFGNFKNFIAESVISNQVESPELRAQVLVYKPIVEAVIKAIKDGGLLESAIPPVDPAVVGVLQEQTGLINDQSKKIKELKMRLKLHEMITNHLSGLNKDIVKDAITKFQGEDEMPEDELVKELTKFINGRKGSSKAIQFESVVDSDIDEVSAILEGNGSKTQFKPKTRIDIKGIAKRVVMESEAVNVYDDNDISPADEFLRDFGG